MRTRREFKSIKREDLPSSSPNFCYIEYHFYPSQRELLAKRQILPSQTILGQVGEGRGSRGRQSMAVGIIFGKIRAFD